MQNVDFGRGDALGGAQGVAEDGLAGSLKNLGRTLPMPLWDAWQLRDFFRAQGVLAERMELLKRQEYYLMNKLGMPGARYDYAAHYYLGAGGVLHDRRTGAPVKRVQGR